jgi:hypothetical protein
MMQEERGRRERKRGSLVFPILLIVLGVLFLLDNIAFDIDWDMIWNLWPLLLILMGLEVLFGRRISVGAVLLVIIVFVIAGMVAWGSFIVEDGETQLEHISWPSEGVERVQAEFDIGVGRFELSSYEDMGDLMVADLELTHGDRVDQGLNLNGDLAKGWIAHRNRVFGPRFIFGDQKTRWSLLLNQRVPWEKLEINSGVGDISLDLLEIRASDIRVDIGVGSLDVTLPRRGMVKARVDGGIGDLRIRIPEGVPARIWVDRGLGDLRMDGRFKKRGDRYETEDFSRIEGYIELWVDFGIGSLRID